MKLQSKSRATKTRPENWTDLRLRFLCSFNPSKSEVANLDPETEVSFVPMERISTEGDFDLSESKPVESVYSGFTYFRNGDVVIAKITPCFENGKGGLASGLTNAIGFGTTEFHVLRPISINGRYLEYLCRSHPFRTIGETEMYGAAGQKRIPETYLKDEFWPIPPLADQPAIADFLERETAQIDKLIAKEQRLLALLEEKRTALISHAVTKGLDPNAGLKDSGIEWLGQIPKDWEVRPLKYGFRFKKGPNAQLLTSSYISEHEGEYPVYSGQTESGGVMGMIDTFVFDMPDVIFTTTVGAKVMTSQVVSGKFSLSQNCVIMIPAPSKANARFFSWQLETLFSYEKASIPSHMQPSLRISDLNSYKVAYPPPREMEEIVDYLHAQSFRFDALKTRINRAIELLREKRTALISAAVTGKINIEGGN